MYADPRQKLGLSDLLDQDLTSYEYFHSLPKPLQKEIIQQDIGSFAAMQECVRDWKKNERYRGESRSK